MGLDLDHGDRQSFTDGCAKFKILLTMTPELL